MVSVAKMMRTTVKKLLDINPDIKDPTSMHRPREHTNTHPHMHACMRVYTRARSRASAYSHTHFTLHTYLFRPRVGHSQQHVTQQSNAPLASYIAELSHYMRMRTHAHARARTHTHTQKVFIYIQMMHDMHGRLLYTGVKAGGMVCVQPCTDVYFATNKV
jgi:hypothetical protein